MKHPAVVFAEPGRVELADLPMPPPREGEVQVRTLLSAISAGTEGWCLRNRFTWSPTPFPCVPGYQLVGHVVAVGAAPAGSLSGGGGGGGWRIGERVMAVGGEWEGPIAPFWGGHARVVNVPEGRLFHLPARISDSDAAGMVVSQVGFNAANRLTLAPTDWVVIFGDGMVGQFAAQAARVRKARVVVVGHREARLRLARTQGADAAIHGGEEDVDETIRRLTGGRPVAAVIDTVQTEEAQHQYLDLLEPGRGQVVYGGFTPDKAWADMGLLQQRELTAYFVAGWNRRRIEATLALLATGRMMTRPLLTHRVPYARAPEMYGMILEKSEPFLGIELDWSGAL